MGKHLNDLDKRFAAALADKHALELAEAVSAVVQSGEPEQLQALLAKKDA